MSIKFEFRGKMRVFEKLKYDNDRLALVADHGTEDQLVLTVNMPNWKPKEGEFCVKGWSEGKKLIEAARASGLFIDTGKRVQAGYTEAEVWKLK